MATIGYNQIFWIKNGDGTSFHNLALRKSTVESIVMSFGDKITGDVYYKDNTLSVTMHEYITHNGVNYMLVNPPTVVREGVVSDNSELKGMTKYSFVFYHPMCLLANFPFSDVAVTSDETRYLGEGKTFSWIGKPADFVAKLNKNLTGTEWVVELSSRFPQDKLDELSDVIPFDNATIADACKTFYDTWGVPYVVDKVAQTEASYANGKRFKIVMGLPSNEIYSSAQAEQQGTPFVFQMGHGVGLKNNSRTPRNNKIITRISGHGSESNIPYGYPQVRWYGTAGQAFTYGDHAGVYTDVTIDGVHLDKVISYPIYKGVLGGEYVELIQHPFTRTHLMPSVYRTCLFNKISFLDANGEFNTDYDPDITLIDYYDAVYSSQYPYPNIINLQAPSYESHEFENEKPELGEAHIISATPLNNDLTPASSWDDSLDDDGNYKQSYFEVVLPQLSFDLYACASITEEMQINMRSGTCLGCTFTVQVDWDDYKRNFYDEEGNFAPNGSQRDLTKYPKSNQGSISLVLQKDNSTFGTLMPNMYQYPKGETSSGAGDGDTFVILGISLPESYIFAAEWRLDADMKSYMLENNVHYFDYPLKFDEDFLFHNENILSQIRPNTVVRFNYAGQTQALFVKQITVKYGDQPLPQYDITLTDNVEVVLNQIGHVAEDVEKLSTLIAILRQSYGKNVWNELAKKLSKTQDDTAAGYITMLKGLQIGANFIPDILGEGGVLRMREDGKVELVTDILYARVKAYFDSVEIREYQHTGGNRIASVAGNKICRVSWFNSSNVELEQTQANLASVAYFRCYFRASDGEDTVRNNWVVGDQAYCHITSVTTSSDNPEQKGLNQKHLWRLVVGRNTEGALTEDGEAYIDLSNRATETISGTSYTGYQSGSDIPEAQDDIIQLGNVNDTTRQGAIVEFVTGTDAPSYQIYQGINSFSLNGKNQITIGYNTQTGRAEMKVYGDAYIGDPNGTTFIKYEQRNSVSNAPKVTIKAEIEAQSTIGGSSLPQYIKNNQNNYDDTEVRNLIDGLQDQIDGQIESWFYNYAPVSVDTSGAPTSTTPLNVAPYSDWTTDADKIAHLGDTFTNNSTGYCWRFSRDESTQAFIWVLIEDSAVISALQNAARAQDTADHKRRVFLTTPTTPYDAGDLWAQGENGDLMRCITSKATGSYDADDWDKAVKYTDDTVVEHYMDVLTNGMTTPTTAKEIALATERAIRNALGGATITAGGLMLTSMIALRQFNGGDASDYRNYTTWAGISGTYDANALGGGIAAWYGGLNIDKEALSTTPSDEDWDTIRWAKGLDRFDGSGYRANGNITWDAQGRIAIKDITTLIGSDNTNVLNELTTFNNAFHFNTTQGTTTVLSIVPQVGFTSLNITENGTLKPVATQEWVNNNYVTKTFFDKLFQLYNGDESSANKIAVNGALPTDQSQLNIQAMFGFWTKKYISALGQGDDGTTSYTTLAQLNDVQLSDPANGQVLMYNSSTNKWYNGTVQAGTDMATVWAALAANTNEQIVSSHLTTALSGYALASAIPTNNNQLTNGAGYITSSSLSGYATQSWVEGKGYITSYVDTKNTAGSTDNAAHKLYLVGALSQAANPQTYSNINVYIGTDNCLYSNGVKVLTSHQSLAGYATETWVTNNFNNYSLPLAASGTRGGVQIGYTTSGKNYAVQLSSEKMYVNVPWTDTTYTAGTGLALSSGAFAINSTYQTYISHGKTAYGWGNHADAGYVTSSGVTSVATGTGLTGGTITSTGTISINSTYQTYISHGESAYGWGNHANAGYAAASSLSNYLPLTGGTISGNLIIGGSDVPEVAGNLASYASVHSIKFYRNGFLIPYQMDNTNDGGMLRVRGTSESNCIFELGTWDDSGAGETIQFNYYPTTSTVNPTYSVSVPKKSGTIALTSDLNGYIPKHNIASTNGDIPSWGTLTSANGYSAGMIWSFPGGSDIAFAYKSGQVSVQVDGCFYQNEGKYACLDEGLVSLELNSSGLLSGYGGYIDFHFNGSSADYTSRIIEDSSGTLHFFCNIYASGGITALSDARHKNVVSDVKLTVEQIAKMRAINYYWKDGREDKSLHVGSIAQDWERVMPEVVLRANNDEGTLSLQYGVAALVASIINARKIVSHEKRITDLERECERLKMENELMRSKLNAA